MQKQRHPAAPVANSIENAAKRLGISRAGLYNLLALGEIRAVKVGARRLIPETELQGFITRRLGPLE